MRNRILYQHDVDLSEPERLLCGRELYHLHRQYCCCYELPGICRHAWSGNGPWRCDCRKRQRSHNDRRTFPCQHYGNGIHRYTSAAHQLFFSFGKHNTTREHPAGQELTRRSKLYSIGHLVLNKIPQPNLVNFQTNIQQLTNVCRQWRPTAHGAILTKLS